MSSGTLSFEGSAGQLFSITNNLTTGSIFSVNDVSGIPSIDVDADGTVEIAPYSGNVGIGTTTPTQKLDVNGNIRLRSGLYDFNNTLGTAGFILTTTGSGIQWTSPSALQGIQGTQGRQGANGFQGIQGTTGSQGANGFQGLQGTQGANGFQGIQGTSIQGQSGTSQGIQGANGRQGIQGANGFQGLQGTQGANGFQGIQGTSIQGQSGTSQGIQGTQGANGFQGLQGTSVQGLQGPQGANGIQGLQGTSVQGLSGTSQGIQGANGFQGIQGTSVQGTTGTQGTSIASSLNATAVTTDTKLYPVLVYAAGSNQTAQTITSFAFNSTFGTFTIGTNASTSALLHFNGSSGISAKGIQIKTADVNRWYIGTDISSEAGSNTGTNLQITSASDTGSGIARAMTIYRSNGAVSLGTSLTTPYIYLPAKGTGTTERQIMWNYTGRDVYFYGRDSDQMLGLYDSVSGHRFYSSNNGNFNIGADGYSTSFYTTNWFRSIGNTGWFSSDHGGGIYMDNASQVKVYNNKSFWVGAFGASTSGGPGAEDSSGQIMIQNGGGTGEANAAVLAFHCSGAYGAKLHLRPDGYMGMGGWSAYAWRWYVNMATGDMTAAGNITAYSDIRLKENITQLENSLYKIKQLNGVRFTWKDLPDIVGTPGKADFGILAHEVESVAPELISESAHKSPDGDSYKTVAYDKLVPMLIEAIKEMSNKIDNLEGQIEALKNK